MSFFSFYYFQKVRKEARDPCAEVHTLINCIVKNWTDLELHAIWKIAHLPEPRFFTLTKVAIVKFCHRHMGEIYVMDQNNSVFLYERGFIQPEMGIL